MSWHFHIFETSPEDIAYETISEEDHDFTKDLQKYTNIQILLLLFHPNVPLKTLYCLLLFEQRIQFIKKILVHELIHVKMLTFLFKVRF